MKFLQNTNWKLMARQKETLFLLAIGETKPTSDMKSHLEGVLGFLDVLMDEAAETLGEDIVFPVLEMESRNADEQSPHGAANYATASERIVVIQVRGGVVQQVDCPPDVRVVVRDYDVEGSEANEGFDIRRDDNGHLFQYAEFLSNGSIDNNPTSQRRFTVVGLYLDRTWDGEMREAAFVEHVEADSPGQAGQTARMQAAKSIAGACGRSEEKTHPKSLAETADGIAILAAFPGHLMDLIDSSDDPS